MAAKTRFTIGREQDCDIAIADSSVSRLHAEISLLEGEKLLIRDCNSRNGTEIIHSGEARRITQDTALAGDTLRFGVVTIAASELLTAIRMLAASPPAEPEPPKAPASPPRPPQPAPKIETAPLPAQAASAPASKPSAPAPVAKAAPQASPKASAPAPTPPAKASLKASPKAGEAAPNPLPKPEPKPEPMIKTELIRCECGAIRPREGRCASCGAS